MIAGLSSIGGLALIYLPSHAEPSFSALRSDKIVSVGRPKRCSGSNGSDLILLKAEAGLTQPAKERALSGA
jgi:hypothetical protein